MSSRPEEEEEVDEIEEGEIVSDQEEEEDIEFSEGEEEDFYPEDDMEMDTLGVISSLLATPDGDTVCSALVNLCNQLETQNKILIKMLARMHPPKSA